MIKRSISILFTFIFALLLLGCNKVKSYPKEPDISFKSLEIDFVLDDLGNKRKMAILTISFIDGDGDIGVLPEYLRLPSDTFSKIHYTWLYKTIPDETNPGLYPLDTFRFQGNRTETSARIPWDWVMDKRTAHNKFMKGSIEAKLSTPIFGISEIDTMLIDFFITDRANNKSNVVRTPMFSIHNSLGDIKN